MTVAVPEHTADAHGDCPLGSGQAGETPCKACPHTLWNHVFHVLFCRECHCPNFTCTMCGGGVYL